MAVVAAIFSGALHLADSSVLSVHLLLLPRSLLQSVLGRSSCLRGWGTKKGVHQREWLATQDSERPQVLPDFRPHIPHFPLEGCVEWIPL